MDELQDEVVIALCTAENERIVEFFDTSTEEHINMNNKLCEVIVRQMLLPLLPEVRNALSLQCEYYLFPQFS